MALVGRESHLHNCYPLATSLHFPHTLYTLHASRVVSPAPDTAYVSLGVDVSGCIDNPNWWLELLKVVPLWPRQLILSENKIASALLFYYWSYKLMFEQYSFCGVDNDIRKGKLVVEFLCWYPFLSWWCCAFVFEDEDWSSNVLYFRCNTFTSTTSQKAIRIFAPQRRKHVCKIL